MNTPFYISRKLSLSSSDGRGTPAVKVAVAAVAISVAVMLASIAVVLGFKNEIRAKVVGFNSDVTLYAMPNAEGDPLVTLDRRLQQFLDTVPFITSYSLEVSMPAIFKTADNFKGIYIKGKAPGADLSLIENSVVDGKMPDFGNPGNKEDVAISAIAARQLGLKAGDKIDTYFITDDVRVRRLNVAAVFDTHFETYDDVIVFGNISLLQDLAGIRGNQGTAVKVMTDDFEHLDENTSALHNSLIKAYTSGRLPDAYATENVNVQGSNYFQWLELLDTNVAVILILMIAVGCVTLISGLLILIIDKARFIGIVRSMGISNRALSRVFTYLSLRVAVRGLVIGNVLMIGLLVAQHYLHFIPLDGEAYYFDYVPVSLDWVAFAILDVCTLIIIFLALLLPSRYVSRISPAAAMRYE